MDRRVETHEQSTACGQDHCSWHGVDEPFLPNSFEACMECGHVWHSEVELIEDDFATQQAAGFGHDPVRKVFGRDVHYCPFCAHSF